jgi:hypothetical protein
MVPPDKISSFRAVRVYFGPEVKVRLSTKLGGAIQYLGDSEQIQRYGFDRPQIAKRVLRAHSVERTGLSVGHIGRQDMR